VGGGGDDGAAVGPHAASSPEINSAATAAAQVRFTLSLQRMEKLLGTENVILSDAPV
jgi:hypothetical protein